MAGLAWYYLIAAVLNAAAAAYIAYWDDALRRCLQRPGSHPRPAGCPPG